MNIDTVTGELKNAGKNPRFTYWTAFLLFSTIVMATAVGEKKKYNEQNSNANWAVTCSAITFSLTFIVVGVHMSRSFSSFLVGTKIEGGIIAILAIFWTSIVAIVSNATNGIAVNPEMDNTIANGNLYYFSWAGFVTSILLLVNYLKSMFGLDLTDEIQSRSARLTIWAAMLAFQLVVMGSSANIYTSDCVPQTQTDAYCSRTSFGIVLGCIGTLAALGITAIKMVTTVAPFLIEGVLGLFLVILNGFGVAFLTAPDSPGSSIGNLYYFSWLSFLCSGYIVSKCYEDYRSAVTSPPEEVKEAPEAFDDVPDLDDAEV